ncbi:MAG: two-component regulator propeller domain-containing protein [Bacteroidota bacterium]|nr:two-component regulator propeller domain-containing protein [Bacteroidota bacterium]
MKKSIFFICFLPLALFAQYGLFKHLTIENDLQSNNISAIVQDKYGFIWFGSAGGLSKYDGYSFQYFVENKEDRTSLFGSFVDAVVIDKQNNLWIGTNKGLNKFNYKTNKFERIKIIDSLEEVNVARLFIDSHDVLWFGCLDKVYTYDIATSKVSHFEHDENDPTSIGPRGLMAVHEDIMGNIWLATWDYGIYKYDRKTGVFTHYLNNPNDPTTIFKQPVFSITSDKDGNIWACANVVSKLNPRSGKFSLLTDYLRLA